MHSEITITRANPLVDPVMHVWGWEIPVYLFLGGLVAGLMVIGGFLLWSGRYRGTSSVARTLLPVLGLVLLSIGMGALFLDLEHKPYVWRLYTTFMPQSPMSWGAWILVLVYPALLAHVLVTLPAAVADRLPLLKGAAEALAGNPAAVRAVAALNMALGVALGIYTGILLSALGARPLWNSALLGPLFLLSGFSSAAALAHVLARDPFEREHLARADNFALGFELLVIALFFVGLVSATRVHMAAAGLFFGGPFTAVFWVGVVACGILVPLVLQLLAVEHRVRHSIVPPLLVLGGGLLLRFVIVYAGQVSHWSPA